MLTTTINGAERQMRCQLNEITLDEFERLCQALNEETEEVFERYIKVFSILGLSDDDVDLITIEDFKQLIRQFADIPWDNNDFVKELHIEGKVYTSYTGDKYTLSIRDLSKIEKYMKKDKFRYIGEMMAIIYKDKSISKDKWYEEFHIKETAEVFRRSVTADFVLPYINLILKDIVATLKRNVDALDK